MMDDSKSDPRVMGWLAGTGWGTAAAREHDPTDVPDRVLSSDELAFDPGGDDAMPRTLLTGSRRWGGEG